MNPQRKPQWSRRKFGGFTMLELMIIVAIIALLAAIAIPSYGRYAYRARRADGKDAIMRIANAQERYYTAHNKYAAALSTLGSGFDASEKGYYALGVATSNSDQNYTITATPQNGQTGDACGNLTLTDQGVKDQSGDTSNGACW
ncbi:MAG TPA: type IV pilin protein [Rhodanobacteraceae bacterium]|nr:type IV pilin protein [Rhodanobacteraceae bacterium]